MKYSTLARINKLNALLTLSQQVYESTWRLDYEDTRAEFTEELKPLLDASQALENKVMIEIQLLRAQLSKQLVKESI